MRQTDKHKTLRHFPASLRRFSAGCGFAATLALLTATLASCSGFLEEYSQDTDYVRSWKDLDELLIGDCYWPVNGNQHFNSQSNLGMFIHLLADEVEEQNTSYPGGYGMYDDHQRLFGYLTWQQRVGQNETYSGFYPENAFWTQVYKKINIANNILNSLNEVSGTTDSDREGMAKVEGETRFLRAYYYLTLVSLYGQPYAPATASSEKGVPLKTSPEVADMKWKRNSVAEVFELIESDLVKAEEAFNSVKSEKKSIYRADQTAVRLLLSRVYLYMQQWQKAADYAQQVISSHGQLCNLNSYTQPMMVKENPENLFSMGGDDLPAMMGYQAQGLRISNGLYNSYDNNDLRRQRWIWKNGSFQGITLQKDARDNFTAPLDTAAANYYYYGYTEYMLGKEFPISSLFWLRSAEAYLNLAEAQAYLGNNSEALKAVNSLRRNRFPSNAQNCNLTSTGSQLISDIRKERRLELILQGQRWFDLRRYRVCEVQPERISITHNYTYFEERGSTKPLETHCFVLTKDDPSWTQPIPQEVLDFNTGMENNGNLWREYTVIPITY